MHYLLMLLIAGLVVIGLQPRARLYFPSERHTPDYYWASEFQSAADCEETLRYLLRAAGPTKARCDRRRRYHVWWLELENLALVQLPHALKDSASACEGDC